MRSYVPSVLNCGMKAWAIKRADIRKLVSFYIYIYIENVVGKENLEPGRANKNGKMRRKLY